MHLGDADEGMKLVRMAAHQPVELRRIIGQATLAELVGLTSHLMVLEECAKDVIAVFRDEAKRKAGL